MIKTISTLDKQEKHFNIPKSAQDTIPIKRIWKSGIFLVGKNKYSLTYKFTDINYAVASREDKEVMFLNYSELLNSFDSEATTKITINLRKINKKDFEKDVLLNFKNDGLDIYRKEYNDMLLDKALNGNGMIRELYLTVSIFKKNYEEARNYFRRTSIDIISHLAKLGSKCEVLNVDSKLRLLHDFYRIGEETNYNLDLDFLIKHGHNFKDYICPNSISFNKDYFEFGNKFGCVLFLKDYATYIKDNFITELTDISQNMMLSIDVIPVSTDEAVKEVESRLLGVETNIANWQRKQNANNNFSAVIPYDLELQRKETKEFLDDLTTRDQRMMFANLTLVVTADSKEQLSANIDSILMIARKHLCQIAPLTYQQLDGFNTVLPFGVRNIKTMRTLTTESLAVLNPFNVQEIQDSKGVYYGENAISHNLIMVNNSNLLNQSSFILGVPGSGKSFSAKELITFLALSTDDDIIICDPEGEYTQLVKALGGEVIDISAGSKNHINAMDMVEGYGENTNPVIDKAEFVLSLFEQLDRKPLNAKEKSIVDRCTSLVYEDYNRTKIMPTLVDLRQKLLEQPEAESKDLALSLELFTSGSLNVFAHKTNVNTSSRILSYDIYNLGKQLKNLGLLVITDAILNRVNENFRKGKKTHLIIDEIHILYANEYSRMFLNSAWRQYRKRNACPVAITQNADYVLSSVESSTMLSNSEFIVMFNQATNDRERLASLLNISEEQMSYITNSDAGCGLIKYQNLLVPFVNDFPKDTKLYRLMTTKPGESHV